MERESKTAGVVAGLLLAAVGVLIAWSTSQMRVPPMHAKVGPQVFPYFAAAALLIVGACFIVQALRAGPDAQTLIWDGKDQGGTTVPAGIYIYQLSVGGETVNGTVVVAQ